MDESDRVRIRSIKNGVASMLEERQALDLERSSLFSPSRYWSDFCSCFDYVSALPEEYFTKLRLHTYHITGDNYQRYYFGNKEDFMSEKELLELTEDIPREYIINEPDDGIGFRYSENRFVSRDIIGCQKIINTLYRSDVIPELRGDTSERCYVLEIGGGYGALAHHLSNVIGNCTYIIIDLPETLLFSGSYLSLLNPEKNIYFYCKNDFQEFIRSGAIGSYDFVLLPNYRYDSLVDLQFDLVISIASLQEMREEQVVMYLDFVQKTCKGVFYSSNRDHQPLNSELSNLSALLREKFELHEVVEKLRNTQGLKRRIRRTIESVRRSVLGSKSAADGNGRYSDLPYHEYICRRKRIDWEVRND